MITKHGLFLGYAAMPHTARLATGFAVLLLAAMFTLIGCTDNADDAADDDTPNPSSPATGVQVYILSGTTFTEYPGTGTAQDVTGKVAGNNDIGKIGTISKDGKLTLALPATVDDSKLSSMGDLKMGTLETSPSLELKKSDTDIITLMYFNKDYSADGASVTKGWNYFKGQNAEARPTTNTSGYKWVITTGQ
jgi:hypothetical protein